MNKMEKTIKKVMNHLLLLSSYLVILKVLGWLTKGWLFALAPLLVVAAAFTVLLTQYIIERHGTKKSNQ